MKTRTVLLGAALVLLLASCFSPLSNDGGTGSITISVPSLEQAGISSSDLSASAAGDGNYYARAFIYRDGSEVGFGETNVANNSPSELTIAGIPEGGGYSLVVTIGTKDRGVLFPEKYGISSGGSFSITGGRNTGVSVAVQDSPFFYARPGEALKGVAVDGDGALVTASESTVYAFAGSAIDGSRFISPTDAASAGFTVNGLNQGATSADDEVAWASGPQTRIVPFDYSGGSLTSMGNIVPSEYIADGQQNILSSQGYSDTIDGQSEAVAMFQIDGGLGGGLVDGTGTEWGDTGEDLKDFVSGQPVLTINIWERPDGSKNALFATKIGAFAVTQEIFEGADQDAITEAFLTGEARPGLTPITLIQGGQARQISAMSAGVVGGTGRVFLGTARGVFGTNASTVVTDGEINVGTGEAQPVPGTEGLQVYDLEFLKVTNGPSILATLTRSRLVVTNLTNGASVSIPNVAGVPGIPALGRSVSGVKAMALVEAGADVYLALAGDFGFAGLDVQGLFE